MTDKSETVTISRETFDILAKTYHATQLFRQADGLLTGGVIRILTDEQEEELRK